MDRIAELLANLQGLSPEEMTELNDLVNSTFDELAGGEVADADTVAKMDQLVQAAEQVRTEGTRRETERQEAITKSEELKARMEKARNPEAPEAGADETATGETDDAAKAEADAKAKAEAEGKPAGEGDGSEGDGGVQGGPIGEQVAAGAEATPGDAGGSSVPVTVVAAGTPRGSTGGQVSRMAAVGGRAEPRPGEGNNKRYGAVITAAAGLPHVTPGDEFTDPMSLAKAMSSKLQRLQTSHDHTSALIASVEWEYPEDRQLGDNAAINSERVEAVCRPTAARYNRQGALVATGGICLPVNVDYAVPTWSSADRPLRDALPAYQASRGGIRYVQPPDIGTVDLQGTASGSGLATTVWPEATDASPGGATKPVWQVACGTEELIYVDAIPTRVEFGNMQSRFAPEQVAANTEQAMAAAAREQELNLLTKMYHNSNQVLASKYLGATRDILTAADLIIAQYRYSHRFPDSVGLTAIFPEWAKALIRSDMAREIGHDNTNQRDVMAISDAQIEDWFATRGVEVVWTMEGLKAAIYGVGGTAITDQFFPKVTAGNAPQWPGQISNGAFQVAWLLFVTGTFQFLDGGRLDLGVVRDSLLDATNDYETFIEVFESVAFRGVEALQVQSTVLPTGGTAGTVAATSYAE